MRLGLDPGPEMMLAVVTIAFFAILVSISFGSLMWLIRTWMRGK
ncbi:MAG TPA: hypothetical protein VGQ59_09650 [Cyclobacteriaceae bacterium]|jgi:hypothetical protein|nr:hypothetical protein [Cyclobacteriaceae bacterium]